MSQPDDLPILLVEDNPDHEELIRRAFADRGVQVSIVVARHGEEALEYLFRQGAYADAGKSPRPCLILLDLRLPRVDGLEVLGRIKSSPELRSIPTVVLTTSESEHDVARACAEHANSYLVKPVDFKHFEDLIGHVESYWLTLNRQPGGSRRPRA